MLLRQPVYHLRVSLRSSATVANTGTNRRKLESELAGAAAFRTGLRHFLARITDVASKAGLTAARYDLLLMLRTAGPSVLPEADAAKEATRRAGIEPAALRLCREMQRGKSRFGHTFSESCRISEQLFAQ